MSGRRRHAIERGDGGAPLCERPQVRPHHVGISVSDLGESVLWYGEILGFALEKTLAVPDGEGRMAMLVNEGGFRVELFELPGAAPLPEERRHPATDLGTQGVKHLAYEVADIDAFAARLRDLGADIVWDVRNHDDVKVLFLRDPTGNLVELVEPVEPVGHERTREP